MKGRPPRHFLLWMSVVTDTKWNGMVVSRDLLQMTMTWGVALSLTWLPYHLLGSGEAKPGTKPRFTDQELALGRARALDHRQ